jgi:hypothetical protein
MAPVPTTPTVRSVRLMSKLMTVPLFYAPYAAAIRVKEAFFFRRRLP